MKTRNDLGFTLGDVKGRAVGFRHPGYKVDHEQREQRQEVPVPETALLALDDLGQVQTARHHQHADQGKTHGKFVGNNLRRRAHRPQKGVLGIGGPAGDDHAIDPHRCQCQDV